MDKGASGGKRRRARQQRRYDSLVAMKDDLQPRMPAEAIDKARNNCRGAAITAHRIDGNDMLGGARG